MAPEFKISGLQTRARKLYIRHLRSRISDPLHRQRLRLAWHVFGYAPLVRTGSLPLAVRLRLVARFVRVDWSVEHAHYPSEMARICIDLASRPGRPGEVVVEAGCWNGGSTAKFSLICAQLGLGLHVYDSFQGVEPHHVLEGEWDFAGQYASPEVDVRSVVARLGAPDVCTFHPGWFADTLATTPVGHPVRMAYVDCDVAKGTVEALQGIVPDLVEDALVYSQDSYIPAVREALLDPATWSPFGIDTQPGLEHVAWCTGRLVPPSGRWHPVAT